MKIDLQNPWHKVKIGDNAPSIVNGIIEIPKNTRAKYELDKESGLLMLDRVFPGLCYTFLLVHHLFARLKNND